MKKANDFQIAKVQFQGIASLLLNFLPVSTLCCLTIKASFSLVLLNYKSVAYKKKRVIAVAERYLIITHVKDKESKKQPFNKKVRNLLVPILQYCQFGQDDR